MMYARRGPGVREQALLLWAAAWIGVMVVSSLGLGLLQAGDDLPGFLDRWDRWDVELLAEIAEFGYDGNPGETPDRGLPAFFPGQPIILRLVHLLTQDWVLAGLLISLAAGAVACVGLARLGELEGPPGAGPRSVIALLVAPPAVFLIAGYSEALFLAFAVPAWLAARRGRWPTASLLAAGASCIRVTGLFLACALVVEYFTSRTDRARTTAWWLAVPFVPLVLYSIYQYGRTGDWLAWKTAQEIGWHRNLVPPWESLATTWRSAFSVDNVFTFAFRLELLAAGVGVAFTLWLLGRNLWRWRIWREPFVSQRWGELVYVGMPLGSLLLSSYYLSIPRAVLLWFPLWLALGRTGTRHPWLLGLYVLISAPLMAAIAVTFVKGAWAG